MKKPASTILLVLGILITVLCAAGALGAVFTIAQVGVEKELLGALLTAAGGATLGVALLVLRKDRKTPAIATGSAAALALVLGIVIIGNKPATATSPATTSSPADSSTSTETATDPDAASDDAQASDDPDASPTEKESTESETPDSPIDEPEEAPYPSITYTDEELEALMDEQDAFAHDLIMEAAQKLVDEGTIRNIDGNGLFPFDGSYGSTDMSLDFENEKEGKYLTHSWPHPEELSGVTIASVLFEWMYDERQESCDLFSKYGLKGNYDNELIDSVPRFYPIGHNYDYKEFGTFNSHPETWDVFADSLDECKYLVAYGAFESKREEDFYMQGDRVTISTLVILIDAKSREIIAIEDLGCDTPPAFKAESATGETFDSEAREFIVDWILDCTTSSD